MVKTHDPYHQSLRSLGHRIVSDKRDQPLQKEAIKEMEDHTKREGVDYTEEEFKEFCNRDSSRVFMRAIYRTLIKANQLNKYGMYDYEKMDGEKFKHYLHKAHTHLTGALGPDPFDRFVDYKGGEPLHEHHALIAVTRLLPVIMRLEGCGKMSEMEEEIADD